ncbi:MAG: tetratricopeptide repeat protein [Candidatus Saccharibacteria bacterium]|nr:tetratricopeptide repeat protein [Candidatus Saccharibacteria bacterium]
MLGILLIILLATYIVFFYPIFVPKEETIEDKSEKYQNQMKKLWNIAQMSMKEKKTMRAEAALLTILKFDEKNAAAYNRLGILYAREKNYDEAIECFEIAQSLDNNASSLHNVGLIYLETGAYEEAAMAFKQALELEDDMPARYLALAKAEEGMGNRKAAVEALESAYQLDNSINILKQILAIYEDAEDAEGIAETSARIEKKITEDNIRKAQAAKAKGRTPRLQKRETKVFYPPQKVGNKKPTREERKTARAEAKRARRSGRKLVQ